MDARPSREESKRTFSRFPGLTMSSVMSQEAAAAVAPEATAAAAVAATVAVAAAAEAAGSHSGIYAVIQLQEENKETKKQGTARFLQ